MDEFLQNKCSGNFGKRKKNRAAMIRGAQIPVISIVMTMLRLLRLNHHVPTRTAPIPVIRIRIAMTMVAMTPTAQIPVTLTITITRQPAAMRSG